MAQRYATVAEVRGLLGSAFDAPAVSDAFIQSTIDDQVCFLGLEAWGDCASIGSKYAAAHVVAICNPKVPGGGQSGLVSSEADGPASRSFAISPATADDSWWSSTCWGPQYLMFRRQILSPGLLILGATSRTRRPW
jgi:hypothetical protein